jgi:putative ABC transport system permease protein
MLKNFIKIAFRILKKHHVYSFINIFGLALGIASCILIYLYVQNELSYDKFHRNRENLYRVYITEDPPERDAFSYIEAPWNLAEALESSFPEIKQAVRLVIRSDVVRYDNKSYTQRYHLVDPDFFELFSFPLLRGEEATVLQDISAVVLTESCADKIFGNVDPLGRQLSIKLGDKFHDFVVSGIARDVPPNSSIRFDMLIHIENVHKYLSSRALDNWFSVFFETYVLMAYPVKPSDIETKLQTVVRNHYPEGDADMVTLHLQAMTDIHLNPDLPVGFEGSSDPIYSYILMAIAVLILGVACINFMTLSVGRAATRTREVGVRKVLGAVRSQLIVQFLGEAALMSVSALFLGVVLVYLFLPSFNAMINKNLFLSYNFWAFAFMLSLMFLVAGIAGSYPAIFMSRFQAVEVMSNKPRTAGANLLVRGLVLGQFALSIGLIVCTLTMQDQLRFLINKDLGFDKNHVVVIQNHSAQDQSRQIVERYRNSLESRNEILGVSGTSTAFARDWTKMGFRAEDGSYKQFYQLTADYDYLETLEIEVLDGRNFSREFRTDESEAIIVNEALVKYMNWDSPIGKSLPGRRFPPHRVIGVVRDFNFESLHETIAPVIIALDPTTLLRGINDISSSYSPRLFNFINVRVKPENIQSTITMLKNTWQNVAPEHPFLFSFLDQDVQQQYREIQKWGKIVSYASIFIILIACLGLFGLATLTVAHRTKEIGIRKILGASASGVVFMLTFEFGKLVILANIIAWPIAYFVMKRWLQDFAFRINLSLDKFFISAAVVLTIALITVSYHSVRAALADPVRTIKYE